MNNTPLDAPILPEKKSNLIQKFFLTIEGLLWLAMLPVLLFILESWEGGSQGLIIVQTALATLYMIFPIFLFGSKGWLRGIGSHLVGLALAIVCIAWVFKLESWPYRIEMGILSGFLSTMALIFVSILLLLKRSRWTEGSFYKHVTFRLAIAFLLSGGSFFSIFFH
jgi:hypothetical protein